MCADIFAINCRRGGQRYDSRQKRVPLWSYAIHDYRD